MLPFHANDILREKPGYAKIRSSSLLRPPSLPSHPFPCYNWLRKDEGRIFRDRSGGKLTTWIPRGVCQLYPYFSVGNSRSHLRGRGWGVGVPRIVEVHTRGWRRRDTAADRNHRCRRNEMQIRGGGGGGEDTSELHFKMLRVSKSTVPSILATISLSLSLFFFFPPHFFQHLHASTFFSIILTSTMKLTISPCR